MVLSQPDQIRHDSAGNGPGPMVRGGLVIAHVHVDVGLGPAQKIRGCMG